MFSSNQVLEVSGCLSHSNELELALEFALKLSGEDKNMRPDEIQRGCKLLYQITEDGKYCIGWGFGDVPDGWQEYPFKFEITIVSRIIRQHLENAPVNEGGHDGSYEAGFHMKSVRESLGSFDERTGIKHPFYGIVYFEPFTCFYSK